MNTLFILSLTSFLFSCNLSEPKIIRKKIESGDMTITWYYHSYITNTSPDFVIVEKEKGNKKEIYKATEVILDVKLMDRIITLRLTKPSKGLVYTRKMENEVYGYQIVYDSTGTNDELLLRPDGILETDWKGKHTNN